MLQMWSVSPVYSLLPVICEVSVSVTNSFMAPIVAVAATICFTQLFCCQILFGCRKLNELKEREREDGAQSMHVHSYIILIWILRSYRNQWNPLKTELNLFDWIRQIFRLKIVKEVDGWRSDDKEQFYFLNTWIHKIYRETIRKNHQTRPAY